jgi:hypothetical protein
MSDYWEERIPHSLVEAEALRNALGSLVAGVCSGYLSHIPHNLSTLKLMTPSKSYLDHLGALVSQSEGRVPHRSRPRRRRAQRAVCCHDCGRSSRTEWVRPVLYAVRNVTWAECAVCRRRRGGRWRRASPSCSRGPS